MISKAVTSLVECMPLEIPHLGNLERITRCSPMMTSIFITNTGRRCREMLRMEQRYQESLRGPINVTCRHDKDEYACLSYIMSRISRALIA
ncbi:hypothetical protein AVEN_134051-1 [Araneus ventricosus]|uniref:Uncharacterized protein n=1 Tax=Araneus ventricosus TaxID=182803 RepID=A0A4Y2M239_ARAVE|nr:hypothetical protein AVEN_134051-1 [Araneus ventricosus]